MVRDDESVRLRAPLRCWHESLVSARTDALIALSRDGALIATGRPVPPGTPLFLEISFDGNGLVAEIDAVAVAGDHSGEGFEVRFVSLDERARELIERVLEEQRPAPALSPAALSPAALSPAALSPAALPVAAVPPAMEPRPHVGAPAQSEPVVAATPQRTQVVEAAPQSAPVVETAPIAAAPIAAAPIAAARGAAVAQHVDVDLEVTDRMERPANVPAPALGSLEETQPFYHAPRPATAPASFELPRTIAVDETPAKPPAPSWLVEAPTDETRPRAPAPSAKPLPAWPTSSLAVPPEDETRPWVSSPRTATPLQPFAGSPSVPLPKIASLEMPGGPTVPAVEETMRWPTASLRVADAPEVARAPEVEAAQAFDVDMAEPAADEPPLDEPALGGAQELKAPPSLSFVPAPTFDRAASFELSDDEDHPPVATSRALFGAPGDLLGDPEEIPVGGGTDFGSDVEATDPGVRAAAVTSPIHTAEDVLLESMAGTVEDDEAPDVVEVSDLDEYRDVLGAMTSAPLAVDALLPTLAPTLAPTLVPTEAPAAPMVPPESVVTALMPRVLAQELQRQALPSLDDQLPPPPSEMPPERAVDRPGATQPYLTLRGADVGILDAETTRLPAFSMPPTPLTDLPQPASEAFDPFAPVAPAIAPPRSPTDVLVPGAFDSTPRSDPALPVELPPVPRSNTEIGMPRPPPAWSAPATAPAELPRRPQTLRFHADDVDAPAEVSMASLPTSLPTGVASPASALLGNDVDDGEVLSLDTPVEGQIESFFDDLAFQAVEPQSKDVNPEPASSWQIIEERAAPAAPPPMAEDEIPLVVGEDLPLVVGRDPTKDPFNGLDWIVGEPAKK